MIAKLASIISVIAALALCVCVLLSAVRSYRKVADCRQFLLSLAAAATALLSGGCAAFLFDMQKPSYAFWKVTNNTVLAAYISSLLSILVGLGWGWSASFATADRRVPSANSIVQGVLLGWLVINVVVAGCLVERLGRYGYDPHTVGLADFAGVTVFMGWAIFFAAALYISARDQSPEFVFRRVGVALGAAALLTGACLIGGAVLSSLLQDSYRRAHAWQIAIIVYPIWIIFLFVTAATLLFWGGKRTTLLLSRLQNGS